MNLAYIGKWCSSPHIGQASFGEVDNGNEFVNPKLSYELVKNMTCFLGFTGVSVK